MKIVILQGAFLPVPPILGGAVEKVWFKVGQEFAAAGHEVIHISRKLEQLPDEDTVLGVRHVRVKGYDTPLSMIRLKGLDLLYTLRAVRKIPSDADVVITNTFWAPVLINGRGERKVYVDVQRMPKGQMKLYKKATRLRANSTSVSSAILEEIPGKRKGQVIMIPNPLPFDVTESIDLYKKEKTVLYTGRVHPEKGLDILMKAFRLLEPGFSLKIVGPWEINAGGGGQEYLETLKKLAEGLPVEFVGPVFNMDTLNTYYKAAAIFVYPSVAEKGETFGLAPLEAMAWGCAPIVSNLDCFHDFIGNEENGLIFDHRATDAVTQLANAIGRLQKEETFRHQLAHRALQVRKSHSSSTIAALFLAEFSTQVANKK